MRSCYRLFQNIRAELAALDIELDRFVTAYTQSLPKQKPTRTHKPRTDKNSPQLPIEQYAHQLLGVNLNEISGFGRDALLTFIRAAGAVITNDLDVSVNLFVADLANDNRWQIEDFHRGFKQLTGSEKCQCRKARSQRNHLACCYQAWVALKVKAKQTHQTIYHLRTNLFSNYLVNKLANPRIQASRS